MPKNWLKLKIYLVNHLPFGGLVATFAIPFFAFFGSHLKECCDANSYLSESSNLLANNFDYANNWLSSAHNYLYPTFLALLNHLGIVSREGIAISQGLLLAAGVLFLCKVIAKKYGGNWRLISFPISTLMCFFSYGYSGFILTEALVLPLTLFLVSFIVIGKPEVKKQKKGGRTKSIYFVQSSQSIILFFSTLLWLTRPGLIWIFFCGFLWTITAQLRKRSSLHTFSKRAITATISLILVFILTIPQYLSIEKNPGSKFTNFFKLNLNSLQVNSSKQIMRYATNLSECGSPAMYFKNPKFPDFSWSFSGIFGNLIARLSNLSMHLISGWDALPSITYIQKLSYFPYVFLTLLSGFYIVATLEFSRSTFHKANLWRSKKSSELDLFPITDFLLLFIFALLEFSLFTTSTEFRFNIIGWVIASTFIGIRMVNNNIHNYRHYFTISVCVSLLVLILGQMTLTTSDVWNFCLK
jgi:hypothetical protein